MIKIRSDGHGEVVTASGYTTVVTGTSVESGRFSAVESHCSLEELLRRFDSLVARGAGYLEVRASEDDFPVLTVGVVEDRAVVHCLSSPDRIELLRGDGSLSPNEILELQIMDEPATFTGDVIVAASTARVVLEGFVRSDDLTTLGEWCEL